MLEIKIPDFAGYGDEDKRRLADEQVRSYLGEALAAAGARLAPLPQGLQNVFDDLVIRTGFTNQKAFRAFEEGARNGGDFDGLAQADAAVVEVADRAAAVDSAGFEACLGEAAAALDRRDQIMRAFGAAPQISA